MKLHIATKLPPICNPQDWRTRCGVDIFNSRVPLRFNFKFQYLIGCGQTDLFLLPPKSLHPSSLMIFIHIHSTLHKQSIRRNAINSVYDLRFSRRSQWRMASSGMWRRVVLVVAATCSRWFLARRFFYPEDGGDTLILLWGLRVGRLI
jgi:hypothetical protein